MTTDQTENPLDKFRVMFDTGGSPEQFVQQVPESVAINTDDCNNLGRRHYLAGDYARAEECFLAVIKADPQHAHAWSGLGLVWQNNDFWDDALKCYMNAYGIDPATPSLLTNMGYLHSEMGLYDHAIRLFERALEIEPRQPRAEGNLGMALLSRHEYAKAWPLMESRFRTVPKVSVMRDYPIPVWDGRPCERLAIWPEQGVGDQLVYATLLPDLMRLGQSFVCELDERLLPAFHRTYPLAQFVPIGHESGFAKCDAHISLMSLCQHLRTSIDDFERQPRALLRADPMKRDLARQNMGPCEDRTRVAISWRSFQPPICIDRQLKKSATLADFGLLGARHDLQLVTVQYGKVVEEFAGWAHSPILQPNIDLFYDIDGVLAVIDACDVVVTTSNVTAHFAGALGKETYLIYRRANAPFFYWQPVKGRSLWYPSVNVVSGEAIDTWEKAIALVNEMI